MAFAINWPPSNSYTTFRWATITGTRSYLQFLLQKNGLGATIARSLQNFFGDSKYLFRPLGFARDKKAGLTWAVLLRRMALGFTLRSFVHLLGCAQDDNFIIFGRRDGWKFCWLIRSRS